MEEGKCSLYVRNTAFKLKVLYHICVPGTGAVLSYFTVELFKFKAHKNCEPVY